MLARAIVQGSVTGLVNRSLRSPNRTYRTEIVVATGNDIVRVQATNMETADR